MRKTLHTLFSRLALLTSPGATGTSNTLKDRFCRAAQEVVVKDRQWMISDKEYVVWVNDMTKFCQDMGLYDYEEPGLSCHIEPAIELDGYTRFTFGLVRFTIRVSIPKLENGFKIEE